MPARPAPEAVAALSSASLSDDEPDAFVLHNAAEQGHMDLLHTLLPLASSASSRSRLNVVASEASLLEKDEMGFLPLHVAVIHQQLDCVLHFLRYSKPLTSAMLRLTSGDLRTPFLHLVLRVGALNASFSRAIVTELCGLQEEEQEEMKTMDSVGFCYGDDVRAVLFAKMTARDDEGCSIFHLCARYDLVVCLDVLIAFYRRQVALVAVIEKREVGTSGDAEDDKDESETSKQQVVPLIETWLEKGNKLGFRPLHEAMKYCATATAGRLVDEYNVDVNTVTSLRQTPAHVAARANFADGVEILSNACRREAVDFTLKDMHGHTAAQVARRCAFDALEMRLLAAEAGKSTEKLADDIRDDAAKAATRFYFHPEVWRHLPMAYHRRGEPDLPPENPERIDTLVDPVFGILRSREFQRSNVKWDHEIERADIADILRVHEYHYVDRVRQKCASLAAPVVAKDGVVTNIDGTSRREFLCQSEPVSAAGSCDDDAEESYATVSLDMDTALTARSFDAAARAAGAVCKAVDEVVAGKCRNAFCIVRPPGHHAGPVGKVVCENDPEGSLGFCLFNNVAVGAAYARAHLKHRGINKVAILDFDVHHGNGTEEIVRQLVPSTKELTFETPYGVGKQIVHQYKPWRSEDDAKNMFFCSVHGYGRKDPENKDELAKGETHGWFYPGSGVSNVKEAPIIWDEGLPFCHEGASASRLLWRSAFRDRILPKLLDFGPDLIFLSAGFDAHRKELVNWGYVSLLEQDYEWLVGHVKQVANTCCEGRLISVLEGGYNFHGRMVSPFARSVAAHARALINPAQERWDEEEVAREAAHEQALLANYLTPAALGSTVMVPRTKKRSEDAAAKPLSSSRSKRVRKEVDYVALAKKLSEQD
uniref:Histone deacetylase domain-containing protein n=1 Tax=Hyaloperonospora arabidopsidis (strain Emoy2) TaxID=559515 RepID=M4BW86_HYAAE